MTSEQEQLIKDLKQAIKANIQKPVLDILAKSDYQFVKDESIDLGSYIIAIGAKKESAEELRRMNIFFLVLGKIPQLLTVGEAGSENCLLTKIVKANDENLFNVAISFMRTDCLSRYNQFFAPRSNGSKLNFAILYQAATSKNNTTIIQMLLNEAPSFIQDKNFMESLQIINKALKMPQNLSSAFQATPASQMSSSSSSLMKSTTNPPPLMQPIALKYSTPPIPPSANSQGSLATLMPHSTSTLDLSISEAYKAELQQKISLQNAYREAQVEIAKLRGANQFLIQQGALLQSQNQQVQSKLEYLSRVHQVVLQQRATLQNELAQEKGANVFLMQQNDQLLRNITDLQESLNILLTKDHAQTQELKSMIKSVLASRNPSVNPEPNTTVTIEILSDNEDSPVQSPQPILHQFTSNSPPISSSSSNDNLKRKKHNRDADSKDEKEKSENPNNRRSFKKWQKEG